VADITITVTDEQWNRWLAMAGGKPVADFLARAGDFYTARLQARLELARRMEREGRL
jgi:hypothetical protein